MDTKSQNATVESSVQLLLVEIDHLKIAQDESEGVPSKATYFQCLIFQKFAILDLLMEVAPPATQQLVLLKRKELEAEGDDLKRLLIPKQLTAEMVEKWREETTEEPFYFQDLPPEVRKIILGYLTAPLDKLALARVIPVDGEMMGWNLNMLRLELVLPIVFERKRKLKRKHAIKLCHVSPELQGVVKNCFERTLADPFHLGGKENYIGKGEISVDSINPVDFTLNPFPADVTLEFDDDDYENEEWKLEQLRILRQIGTNIWQFYIGIDSRHETLRRIQTFLEKTPNLRILSLSVETSEAEDDINALEDIQLPALDHLRELQFFGGHDGTLITKVLGTYRSIITSLYTLDVLYTPPSIPMGEIGYPKLTSLQVIDQREDNEALPDKIARLEPFIGAPIKSFRFKGGYDSNNRRDFRSLMCALSRFGQTLEELEVELATQMAPDEDEGQDEDFGWLANVKFPKLKTLTLIGHPATWAILLCFPALENLTMKDTYLSYREFSGYVRVGDYFDSSNILELSFDKETMYTSNVWKLFPFLKKIQFHTMDRMPYKAENKVIKITRFHCLIYQRRAAEVKRGLGHVNFTIRGSVDSEVVQADDTGLVIEGNVSDDVIQEGSGRILVNGDIRGNIEQRGDGKIYIRGKHYGQLIKSGNGIVAVEWANVNK